MTLEQKVEYLDHRLDLTLEVLKDVVHFTASTNADVDYLEERINEVLCLESEVQWE